MFGSDNQAPAHPFVMQAIIGANEGRAGSYGDDEWSTKALAAVSRVFETDDLDIYFVGTGGAANGLALSVLCPPWGAVLAHGSAHVIGDEGGGPEHFTSGARMIGIGGEAPLLTADSLFRITSHFSRGNVHGPQPRAVTITNLNENGLAYSQSQIQDISTICRDNSWALHMDGARFANAVVASNACAADITWRSGVDALSFGLTKNGALSAEALVLFGKARSEAAPYLRKRAGHLFSKQRFMAAQFVGMLDGGLWLKLGAHANNAAQSLASTLVAEECELVYPVHGNEVFAHLSQAQFNALRQAKIGCYPWAPAGETAYRFVTCWQTSEADIGEVAKALADTDALTRS